jgi:hypothetical protein
MSVFKRVRLLHPRRHQAAEFRLPEPDWKRFYPDEADDDSWNNITGHFSGIRGVDALCNSTNLGTKEPELPALHLSSGEENPIEGACIKLKRKLKDTRTESFHGADIVSAEGISEPHMSSNPSSSYPRNEKFQLRK